MYKKMIGVCIGCVAVLSGTLMLAESGAQTVDGKKIVGGHGHAMPNTYLLRKHIDEIKRVPFDGVIVHVNRNDFAGKEKLRELRPIRWFREPAVTIEDFSIALDDLANTDLGHLKHNILWTGGTRGAFWTGPPPGKDWFDDDCWENVVCNNARVMAEVCKRGGFEAIWFDIEVGGKPGGGMLTWKGEFREKLHPFEDYAAKARQRGRELMQAFTSVKPDFKFIISFGYGMVMKYLEGRSTDALSEIPYGLAPYFLDGLLEGCGEKGQLIESGELSYGVMTYAAYKARREWDQRAAESLCQVPHLLKKSYRHANAIWPDFRSDSYGWHEDDLEKNHFSPERMKHALHNAMAASDEYVWTWSMHAHWWPNRAPVPGDDKEYNPAPAARKRVLDKAYLAAVANARKPMSLDWHPERTSEKGYGTSKFDVEKAFSQLGEKYETVLEFSDGWLFHPADYSTPKAWDWGLPVWTQGEGVERIYDFTPIRIGDYWENQGIGLDGTGVYRRSFRLPGEVRSKRLYLAVAGVAGQARVYIEYKGQRDKSVGRTEGEVLGLFDITETVDLEGDNYLSIYVTSPEGPGGIYGAVRLFAGEKGR